MLDWENMAIELRNRILDEWLEADFAEIDAARAEQRRPAWAE